MTRKISRRDLIGTLGASGLAAGLGAFGTARADDPKKKDDRFVRLDGQVSHSPAGIVDGKVIQPQRELPVLHKTDVLVVGAGPAGVAAALAARRTGAKVTLVDRYGCFGGLWTGGLVLIVVGLYAEGKQVTRGIGEEMMKRLDKLDRGIVNHHPGGKPTVDAEALKYVMVEMVSEAGIDVFLHCWGVDAIVDGRNVKGAVFESKSGRQAILANVVVDCTGDGDLYAAAGAKFEHLRYHVGLVSRIGNLDKVDKSKLKPGKKVKGLGSITPIKGVNWVNMQGPDVDALNVADLTRMEMNHRRFIWKSVEKLRKTPGYEKVYLMETAPQLGVRISRLLDGEHTLRFADMKARKKFPDCVGVGGEWNAKNPAWQIPYGTLVPKTVDNLLAAGRCISGEAKMAELLRVIPPCFVTGHAAGVAAALAVQDKCQPREVEVPKLQKILKEQDAYLG